VLGCVLGEVNLMELGVAWHWLGTESVCNLCKKMKEIVETKVVG
jgi:hypothetical protein